VLGVTNPWTYVIGTAAIILLPGPNSLYVLSVAARRGVRDGYRGAAGVWLGDAVLMVLSAGRFTARRRLSAGLTTLVGGAFLAFGVKLATAGIS
jgi:leucine efflux protein